MKILALETSTQKGGAAIIADGAVLASRTSDRQRSHSELLHVFVDECLAEAGLQLSDMDAFAVGEGPGSFTGIRVAANAGKTFAAATGKGLVTINSLQQIAVQVRDHSRPVLAILNAYKNLLYYAYFEFSTDGKLLQKIPPSVGSVQELDSIIVQETTVAGDGYQVYRDLFSVSLQEKLFRESDPLDFPTPAVLGLQAEILAKDGRVFDWKSFVPLYLRASEAEENRRGALFNSLAAKDPAHGKSR